MTPRAPISAYKVPALIASLLLFVVGGIVLNLGNGYGIEWLKLKLFMETCPRHELRIERFAESNLKYHFTEADYETITIDLSTGAMNCNVHRSIPADGFNSLSPFLLYQSPFTSDQNRLLEIKKILSTLAAPTSDEDASYRYQVHVAFWRDNQLCIYNYSREDRPKLRGLALVLGTDFWFHGH